MTRLTRRLRRWLADPVSWPPRPGDIAAAVALFIASCAAGFALSWYALENGKGHILLAIGVLLLAGWADLARRLARRGRSR